MNNKLPVLVLKGLILFPYSEVRMEVTREQNIKAVNDAVKDYDGKILVSFQNNIRNNNIQSDDIFEVGIEGIITINKEVSKKRIKIVVKGLERKRIISVINKDETFYANIEKEHIINNNPKKELALARRLMYKLQTYINNAPYMSNTLLSKIPTDTNIDELSDLVIFFIPNTLDRKKEYIKTFDAIKRMQMLLADIDREQEIIELENKIDNKLKEQLTETQKQFILREKMKLIKEELGETSAKDKEIEIIKEKIKSNKIPENIKNKINEELKKYEILPSISGESGILKTYIDFLVDMPWNEYTEDETNLNKIKKYLNKTHYGLDNIKTRIIEYIAATKLSKNLNAPIICLVGPPGTGKTTLAYSIAEALNKKFVKVNLSGISDEAEIMGHRKTYVGAAPGRIINGIKKAGSSNPLFLMDEIDKIGKDIKGDPANALLEILDPSQNKHFSDHYLEEEFDLQQVMFVATANYLHDIPIALMDRLEIIELNGYTELEKESIAKNHLIPKIIKEYGFKVKDIVFEADAITSIIQNYTREAGVRELNRIVQTIIRKIATEIVSGKKKSKYIIKKINLKKYLGSKKFTHNKAKKSAKLGYVNGLAYTSVGGEVLPIEAAIYSGDGKLKLTGSLGEVMQESANIAYSYVKANTKLFGIDYKKIQTSDIHIHIPEGAVPKEGPSAGITLTTVLISILTNKKVKSNIGLTGEITLRGDILPIGGLKEKSIGAYNGQLDTIIIPKRNKRNIEDIPKEIRKGLNIILVDNYKEVITKIFE